MKKTIAVDLDDVLANTTENLREYYNFRFGTNIKLEDHKTYALNDVWNKTIPEVMDIVYDFFESDYYNHIDPFMGAEYAIDELVKTHDLILLTSRSLDFEKQTKEWINVNFPNKFSEIVITNKLAKNDAPVREKWEVCLEKNIHIMIEDNLHYAMQNANHGITTYLMDRPWNQNGKLPDLIKRVYSWSDILKLVQAV